jgi:hypothetical protein
MSVLAKPVSGELLIYVAGAVSGWIVARLHRKHSVAILSVYAASVLLFEVGMVAWIVSRTAAPLPDVHVAMLVANLTVLMRPLSVFIGGMVALHSDFESIRGTSTS